MKENKILSEKRERNSGKSLFCYSKLVITGQFQQVAFLLLDIRSYQLSAPSDEWSVVRVTGFDPSHCHFIFDIVSLFSRAIMGGPSRAASCASRHLYQYACTRYARLLRCRVILAKISHENDREMKQMFMCLYSELA